MAEENSGSFLLLLKKQRKKVASTLLQISIILLAIVIGLDDWSTNQFGRQGLWHHCNDNGSYLCCYTIDSFISTMSNTEKVTPGWINAVRVLLILAFCIILIVFIVILVEAKKKFCKRTHPKVASVAIILFSTLSAIFIISGASVYADHYDEYDWTANYSNKRPSFILCWISAVFVSAAAVVTVFNTKKHFTSSNNRVGSESNQTQVQEMSRAEPSAPFAASNA
ncbi:uncharacterized protein LOC134231781, partial [Saccostrea cucullata]|uniref:uncharacterized protein LOC134231781 n=1 Tax=Saccostrea cuccullata TaxID=36930 RepID=UPI002ED2748C